jgi:hypothetical protein
MRHGSRPDPHPASHVGHAPVAAQFTTVGADLAARACRRSPSVANEVSVAPFGWCRKSPTSETRGLDRQSVATLTTSTIPSYRECRGARPAASRQTRRPEKFGSRLVPRWAVRPRKARKPRVPPRATGNVDLELETHPVAEGDRRITSRFRGGSARGVPLRLIGRAKSARIHRSWLITRGQSSASLLWCSMSPCS